MVLVFESQGFVVLAVPFRAFIHLCCLPNPVEGKFPQSRGCNHNKNQRSFIPPRSSHTER